MQFNETNPQDAFFGVRAVSCLSPQKSSEAAIAVRLQSGCFCFSLSSRADDPARVGVPSGATRARELS